VSWKLVSNKNSLKMFGPISTKRREFVFSLFVCLSLGGLVIFHISQLAVKEPHQQSAEIQDEFHDSGNPEDLATPPLPLLPFDIGHSIEAARLCPDCIIRNTTEMCGLNRWRDVMQECSGEFLPPFHRSYLGERWGCRWTDDTNDQIALSHDGYSFWEDMDFDKTRIVEGDVTMIQNALKRAQNGTCLKIVVVGGSHCQGGCLRDKQKHCFGNQLADYLNEKFPGNDCLHSSTGPQFCLDGTPSTTHAYKTKDEIAEALPADIVLLEFGNNDIEYESSNMANLFRTGWQLEYIVRKWMEAGVAPMFVESSFHILWDDQKKLFYGKNGEPMHLEFQQEYHVPSISFSKAALPLFWSERFNSSSKFYEPVIFADYVHMRPRGQAIIAAMIMKTFERILDETPERFVLPENLQFIPETYYRRLDEVSIFQVNFNDRFTLGYKHIEDRDFPLPHASGEGKIGWTPEWVITDEGWKNKWGLVSTVPGSFVTVQLPPNAHNLYLTVLKTYENIGIAEIFLEDCAPGFNFATQEVDCLWGSRSSQSFVFVMDFEMNACQLLKISVKNTTRSINKIKLISLALT
jgi:hypothetical protein